MLIISYYSSRHEIRCSKVISISYNLHHQRLNTDGFGGVIFIAGLCTAICCNIYICKKMNGKCGSLHTPVLCKYNPYTIIYLHDVLLHSNYDIQNTLPLMFIAFCCNLYFQTVQASQKYRWWNLYTFYIIDYNGFCKIFQMFTICCSCNNWGRLRIYFHISTYTGFCTCEKRIGIIQYKIQSTRTPRSTYVTARRTENLATQHCTKVPRGGGCGTRSTRPVALKHTKSWRLL